MAAPTLQTMNDSGIETATRIDANFLEINGQSKASIDNVCKALDAMTNGADDATKCLLALCHAICDRSLEAGVMAPKDLNALVAGCWELNTNQKAAEGVCTAVVELYRCITPQSRQSMDRAAVNKALNGAIAAAGDIKKGLGAPCALLCPELYQEVEPTLNTATNDLTTAANDVPQVQNCGQSGAAKQIDYARLQSDYCMADCQFSAIKVFVRPATFAAVQPLFNKWAGFLCELQMAIPRLNSASQDSRNETERDLQALGQLLDLVEDRAKEYESGNCGKSVSYVRKIAQQLRTEVLTRSPKISEDIWAKFGELRRCGADIPGFSEYLESIPRLLLRIAAAPPKAEAQRDHPTKSGFRLQVPKEIRSQGLVKVRAYKHDDPSHASTHVPDEDGEVVIEAEKDIEHVLELLLNEFPIQQVRMKSE